MPVFDFSLQKLLEHRERKEEQSARELAEARQEAHEARQLHTALQEARDAGRARMALTNRRGGVVGHLQNLVDVIGHVDAQIAVAETACGKAEEQVEESMKVMRRRAQERKVIDRLRERRFDQWRIEEAGNERKTMDEFALSHHRRADHYTSTGSE